ncbi:MAG: phosphate/phosphite/phosphonate ABC transporter substrate-binding protein [Treponema sp.]|jgi:phosphonate transport system substrate-binding protein|nr:phosphate/phosphite/phosphonate ABC transporter substrate-binding protein [Treponema sp.]
MKRSSGVFLVAAAVLTMLSAACSKKQEATPVDGERAGWPDKLTIVLMPDEGNPGANTKNNDFVQSFTEFLGIDVEVLESFEYAVGLEALRAGRLDLLLVSPMSYYQAKRVANIEPLVTTGTEGTIPYKTVFIVKSDRDDINTVHDLKGKTFAFVDPASSSGYMFPKAKLIKDLGLDTEQIENPGYFFKTVAYSGKHDSSVMGVVMGDYDGAAVALQIISQVANAGLIKESDLKIIGETEIIPTACYVMRADLPRNLKAKIKEFYLAYDDEEFFRALYQNPQNRFIEAFDSDYDVVYEMVQLLKIEQ